MKTLKTGRKWVACLLMLGGVGGMNAQNEWIEPPVMGWSSWNTYRVNIDEALIRKQADAMVELGLKESGYRYVNIDDGFFGYRDEKGRLHTHPQSSHPMPFVFPVSTPADRKIPAASKSC